MVLITYECKGRKAYSISNTVFDFLIEASKHEDGPYFVLHSLEITEEEQMILESNLQGL